MAKLPEIIGRYIVPPVIIVGVAAIAVGAVEFFLPRYTIVAGPVTGDRSTGINGTFRVERAKILNLSPEPGKRALYFGGIVSDLTGGACIIFPAKDLGRDFAGMAAKTNCTDDASCGTSGLYGYCEPRSKTCWARPKGQDATLCRRAGTPGQPAAWEVDKTNLILVPGPISITGFGLASPTQARVLACLKAPGGSCGDASKLSVWGAPTPIP